MSRGWLWGSITLAGCGGPPIYAACEDPSECSAPEGFEPTCLDSEREGFCTWACATDDDCTSEEDVFVCASFESTEGLHCFPSCEGAADDDPDACPSGYGCRSTGGGDDNRKVCFPE